MQKHKTLWQTNKILKAEEQLEAAAAENEKP